MSVGSWVNWEKPFEDISQNKFNSSLVLISLDHQEEHLELKSRFTIVYVIQELLKIR